ncbi:MAG: acyl-CoA thioesterase [Treponema sp.]|nr:acyl-CoA thioesterase [Treponema sp.]MDE6246107.1 acyl-CoA thioesterase [Treponemataceae bacterium]MBD5406833.1 acyl-CoA thioesterase [Treponema sp.]MBD5409148.1 acyl-CoA thioesterase [Treponema sp.]MBD5410172.1 acyl-CoA thioesterase [Treponema sp.]
MYVYKRKINYHETDKMGITHHSNYIKFMEEARVGFLEEIGLPFQDVEALGIVSPVIGLEIEYKHPSVFSDVLDVAVCFSVYNGVKFELLYTITNAKTGDVVATAKSKHCFMKDGKIYSFKRDKNPMDEKLQAAFDADSCAKN